jgi:hypothetical protein
LGLGENSGPGAKKRAALKGILRGQLYARRIRQQYHFWTYSGEMQKVNTILFMHNLALMGCLLLFMTFGPGRLSLDLWTERRG